MLLGLFMVCEIAHFGYNGATVCILIHRQLSASKWKSSPIELETGLKQGYALETLFRILATVYHAYINTMDEVYPRLVLMVNKG